MFFSSRGEKQAEVTFPTGALHYEELELRGAFHHAAQEVDQALEILAHDRFPWALLEGETIGLEQLSHALGAPSGGPARKWIIDPRA